MTLMLTSHQGTTKDQAPPWWREPAWRTTFAKNGKLHFVWQEKHEGGRMEST